MEVQRSTGVIRQGIDFPVLLSQRLGFGEMLWCRAQGFRA